MKDQFLTDKNKKHFYKNPAHHCHNILHRPRFRNFCIGTISPHYFLCPVSRVCQAMLGYHYDVPSVPLPS